MSVQYPYRAVICGEKHIVKGWRGRKLVTDKGSFSVRHIYGIYGDWQIQNHRLFEVATIQPDGNGGWLVNGKPLSLLQSLHLSSRLKAIPSDESLRVHQDEICAVAWCQAAQLPKYKLTQLLDGIVEFWREASLLNYEPAQKPSWESALLKFSDVLSFKSDFDSSWSQPVWLTEFRPAAKKIPVSPQQKRLTVSDLASNTVEIIEPIKQIAAKADRPKANSKASNVVSPAKSAPDYFTNIGDAAKYIGVTPRTVLNWKKRGWLKVEQNGKKVRVAKTDLDKCKSKQ